MVSCLSEFTFQTTALCSRSWQHIRFQESTWVITGLWTPYFWTSWERVVLLTYLLSSPLLWCSHFLLSTHGKEAPPSTAFSFHTYHFMPPPTATFSSIPKKDIQVFLTWTFSPPASFLLPFSPALFRTSALLWGDPVSLLYSPLSFLSFLYHNFILSRRYHILCGLQQKWGESLTSWWGSRRFGFLFALCWVGVDRHWTATVSPTLTGNSCHLSQVLATSHFHNSRLNIQNKPWHTVGILLICIEWTERINE